MGFVDDLNGIAKCGSDSLQLNIFLNTEIDLKKLTFHQSDAPESSKCLRMHVGQRLKPCPPLKVHDQLMSNVSEITYLGDIVSADGRNAKNILNRSQKGTGLLCQLMKVIHSVNFGYHTVEIALLLRDSVLLNGILTNIEVWHNIFNSEVEELDKIDRQFLQKIFGVPKSVPNAALYLETGLLPISVIVKVRRINYLHTILQGPSTGMLFRVFMIQWYFPCKGDWTIQVKTDLHDFGIECNLNNIKHKSKEAFKRLVKTKAREYAFNMLCFKKESYSKMRNLEYIELKAQEYLLNKNFTYEEIKLVFQFRTRMLSFSENFKAGRETALCPLCNQHSDIQTLMLECPTICEEVKKQFRDSDNIQMSNFFNPNIDAYHVQVLKLAMGIREKKLAE